MGKITITLPDGSRKEYESGVTGQKIAEDISRGLAQNALAVEINGEPKDLYTPISSDSNVSILTFDSEKGREVFWHSSAHILAQAIIELFPKARLTIGPAIDEGFYYDIDHEPFSQEDIENIEKKMKEISQRKQDIRREDISKEKAKELFRDNPYKLELIEEFDSYSIYHQGDFIDLCRGPHIPNTGLVKASKITKVSGAYWRADQNNKQLQRIYAISFPKQKMLDDWLELQEQIKLRDHRKLGKELNLFMFSDLSPGSPFFYPEGTIIYDELQKFLREEYKKRGFKEVISPNIFNKKLWEISGHWENYRENAFSFENEGQTFALKPMNCPGHVLMFMSQTRSYRDLPLRLAEFGVLHRNELSGTLTGLTRVIRLVQDDAHIFCEESQIMQVIKNQMDFAIFILRDTFGFEFRVELSTRPDKFIGEKETWDKAEADLKRAMDDSGIEYTINEGDGAFYGPKIDIHAKDTLGRSWQLSTIQLDFNMPKRFGAVYEGKDGHKHNPVMVHRAMLGSIERFMGIFIEHFAGKFPVWLSPVQAVIIPVSDDFNEYGKSVEESLNSDDFRSRLDDRAESVSYRVRDAQLKKIPYIIVVGQKEKEAATVTIRTRENKIIGSFSLDDFKKKLSEKIGSREIDINF